MGKSEPVSIAVVVLAGGRGTRIGGGKPQLRLGGRTLLERALNQAEQWSKTVAVAAGDGTQLDVGCYRNLADEPELDGPLGGLAAALRFARECGVEAVLTVPVDTPFLPPDLPRRLAAAIGISGAAIPTSGGRLHSVCGLWRVQTLDHLRSYAATGRRALMGLAEAAGFVTVDWPAEPFDPFFNINRPGDLAEAERLLARR